MANVASPENGVSIGAIHGARIAYEMHTDENEPLGRAPSTMSNPRSTNGWRSPLLAKPSGKDPVTSTDGHRSKQVNGNGTKHSDEDIPENMYRPDKDDPEGWIHRDKLAKIESEELQAAGINLANARSRSQSRSKDGQDGGTDRAGKRDDARRRLQSPAEIEEEITQAQWDPRLPEEIEEDTSALQIYSNPVLRKSGSKIPVFTSSPNPIPAERYERDIPIARKRAASGSMSLEGDLGVAKTRTAGSSKAADDSDTHSSAVASSGAGSPTKARSKSVTLAASPSAAASTNRKVTPTTRKTSVTSRTTAAPGQRPSTKSGEQDRPRTAVARPEGDPPWLATMYKPDPRLPPDQQLIPTLAKKQMQAQWAEEGAIPKVYDRQFTPIAVLTNEDLIKNEMQTERSRSPARPEAELEQRMEPDSWPLKPLSGTRSSNAAAAAAIGRPGTPNSIHGGYSPMPKVANPPIRDGSPSIGTGVIPPISGRSKTAPAPTRMQAQNLAQDDEEKTKKGCCCIVM